MGLYADLGQQVVSQKGVAVCTGRGEPTLGTPRHREAFPTLSLCSGPLILICCYVHFFAFVSVPSSHFLSPAGVLIILFLS